MVLSVDMAAEGHKLGSRCHVVTVGGCVHLDIGGQTHVGVGVYLGQRCPPCQLVSVLNLVPSVGSRLHIGLVP